MGETALFKEESSARVQRIALHRKDHSSTPRSLRKAIKAFHLDGSWPTLTAPISFSCFLTHHRAVFGFRMRLDVLFIALALTASSALAAPTPTPGLGDGLKRLASKVSGKSSESSFKDAPLYAPEYVPHPRYPEYGNHAQTPKDFKGRGKNKLSDTSSSGSSDYATASREMESARWTSSPSRSPSAERGHGQQPVNYPPPPQMHGSGGYHYYPPGGVAPGQHYGGYPQAPPPQPYVPMQYSRSAHGTGTFDDPYNPVPVRQPTYANTGLPGKS